MFLMLQDLSHHHKEKYGGKASSLGELIKNNIKVPLGFAISSELYCEFLKYNEFPYTTDEYLACNKEICDFILSGEFSPEMERNLEDFWHHIKNTEATTKYVVRSSALCEDNENYSMAGMFSSFIDLASYEDVKNAIKKCYASLFSDKVISYFIKNNLNFEDLRMGVIIQQFIIGHQSGVNFSADTITMNKDMIHINAVNGICDDYVSGKAPSAFYKLNKLNGEVLESRLPQNSSSLSIDSLNRLYKTTLKIEEIFNSYQDIEWTIMDEDLYILQARPITTFRNDDFKVEWLKEEDSNYTWFLESDEAGPPLINELSMIEGNAMNEAFYTVGLKDYYMDYSVHNGYFYYKPKEMVNQKEQEEKFSNSLDTLNTEGKNIFQDVVLPEILSLKNNLDKYIGKNLSSKEAVDFLEKGLEYLTFTSSNHWPVTRGCDYIDSFMEYCKDNIEDFNIDDFYDLIFSPSILNREREFYVKMAALVNSSPMLKELFNTCQYNELLYARIKKISEGKALLELIEDFTKEFGICNLDGDIMNPYPQPLLMESWAKIIGHIRGFLNTDFHGFHQSIENTLKNKNRVKSHILNNLNSEVQEEFLKKLKLVEKAYLVRDDHHYYFERMSKSYLRLALVAARKILKDNKTISHDEDLYFLTLDEIKASLLNKCNFTEKINSRKELFHRQKKLLPPPYIGKEPEENSEAHRDGQAQIASNKRDDTLVLKGLSGLRKKVKGKVHLGIPNYIDEDCILVIPFTRCGQIEPVISKVKGIIVEVGSPFEHIGIIAREMNIPVLYNVEKAMSLLKNGDIVELDGINGEIIL